MKGSKSRVALIVAVVVALLYAFGGAAGAQDGPTLEVDPPSVDAPGEAEFTLTGSGWSGPPAILPCPGLMGDVANFDLATAPVDCDLTNFTQTETDTDSFEVTVTFDVPAEGLVVAAAEQETQEFALVTITVGAAQGDGGGDDGGGEEALANTGVESGLIAIAGVAVLAGGAMLVSTRRRMA